MHIVNIWLLFAFHGLVFRLEIYYNTHTHTNTKLPVKTPAEGTCKVQTIARTLGLPVAEQAPPEHQVPLYCIASEEPQLLFLTWLALCILSLQRGKALSKGEEILHLQVQKGF